MIDNCGYDFKKSLVVFTIPEVEEEVEQREYRRELYLKFYNLLNKYYFRESDHLMEFKDCHDIVTTELSEEDYAEFQRKLRKYIKEMFAMKRGHVIKESTDATEVYLVFDNVVTREKMMACQKRNCLRESILLDVDQPDESEFHLKEPPVPDMIDWQNRYKWTKLRTVFSWLIVLIICLACYLFFGWVQYQESQLNSTYNYDIDCTVLYSGVDLTVYNASLETADKANYLTCYCQDKSLLNVASAQESFCSAWQKEYLTYKIIPLLISLGIVIVNVLVGQIFRVLSAFECQKNAENEQTSYAFKRGFLLMMNMGIIIILLNFNYNNSTQLQEVSFIFQGKYNDFTSDWYGNIGGIIVLTMVFNITFSLVELIFACFISCLKKCWDTRCCIIETSRPTKQEYIALYSD